MLPLHFFLYQTGCCEIHWLPSQLGQVAFVMWWAGNLGHNITGFTACDEGTRDSQCNSECSSSTLSGPGTVQIFHYYLVLSLPYTHVLQTLPNFELLAMCLLIKNVVINCYWTVVGSEVLYCDTKQFSFSGVVWKCA